MADLTAPHVAGGGSSSPLSDLVRQGLALMGDSSAKRSTGDLEHLMIFFANQIIDEVRNHPYWDGVEVDYYTSSTEKRGIPDMVMVTGLAAKYATQQASQKAGALLSGPSGYYKTLNRKLWERRFTPGTAIELKPIEQTDGTVYETDLDRAAR